MMTMAAVWSQKRSHASTAVMVDAEASNDIILSMEGAKLTHLLSKSLVDLLTTTTTPAAGAASDGNGSQSQPPTDIYQQYLLNANNAPSSIVTTTTTTSESSSIIERAEIWLSSAMATMGVGSNSNTLKFWKAHSHDGGGGGGGGGNEEEVYADGRYLVWLVKEILLLELEEFIPATEENQGWNNHNHNQATSSDADDDTQFRNHVMEVLECWHQSALDLLSKNGVNVGASYQLGNDSRVGEEEDGGDDTAGAMWLMLLQNAHLTPGTLRDAFNNFTSPQHQYEQNVLPRDDIDGDDNALPPEYFAWPTFFRCAASEATRHHAQEVHHVVVGANNHPNKRRRSNNSTALLLVSGGSSTKSNEWWPLLGYLITYAFISSSSPIKMTIDQKLIFVKEKIVTSLPSMMLIPNFDYNTKNSLLSGIVACIFDELGDWIVSDSLAVSGVDDANDSALVRMDQEMMMMCNQRRANVCRVVDLMLVDGILPNLAALTRTPLAHLVSEMADAFLKYSEINHRLQYQRSLLLSSNNEDDEIYATELHQHIANDASQVVRFIEQANPQLKLQLSCRKLIPRYYTSSTHSPHPASAHPVVIYTCALLSSNNLLVAADVSCTLEDCTGVDDATKKHCYLLLFEKLQDTGVLFENGWNTKEGGVTLANISLGALGRDLAIEYLKGIVLTAKEGLLSSSLRHDTAELERLRCVKDIVRRTALKFLLPRAYSPQEALSIATTISDARDFPHLDNTAWGTTATGGNNKSSAIDVVHSILTTQSLHPMWNGKFVVFKDTVVRESDHDELDDEASPREETAYTKHDDGIEIGTTDEKVNISRGDQESGVIDLEDTEDEEEEEDEEEDEDDEDEEEAEPHNVQLAGFPAAESIGCVKDLSRSEEVTHDDASDLKEENRVTYPKHYHQFAGNYSESDDYDHEDEEEADRHLAYERMYDAEEGQGESDGEEYDEQSDEEVIEIQSSDEEEEEEEEVDDYDDYEENAEVDGESSEEEKCETEILNEAVNQFIAKTEGVEMPPNGNVEADITSDDIEQTNEQDRNILKAAHLQIIATNDVGNSNRESGEMAKESGTSTLDDQLPALGIQESVNSSDEVEEFHAESYNDSKDHVDDAPYSSEELARGTTDTDDMQMADDEHESIDTEDDKRSLAALSVDADDDKSSPGRIVLQERESMEHDMGGALLADDAPLNTSDEHDSDDDRPSVLVAAAMSSQRIGNNQFELSSTCLEDEIPVGDSQSFDDTSAAQASMDANLWENYDDTSQGEIDVGGTVDVEIARYLGQDLALRTTAGLLSNADNSGEESGPETAEDTEYTDDGYVPDAEVTEEECAGRANHDDGIVDDGYIPDAEFTEEDRPDKSPTKEERAVLKPRAARSLVIDNKDTVTETMRVEIPSSPAKGIDAGYLPDGHTTAGEASEDDQCDEAIGATHAVRKGDVSEQNVSIDDVQPHNEKSDFSHNASAPAGSRMDDAMAPSTADETENILNEEENLAIEMSSNVRVPNIIATAATYDVVEQSSAREDTQEVAKKDNSNVHYNATATDVAVGDDAPTEAGLVVDGNREDRELSKLDHVDTNDAQTETELAVDGNRVESEPPHLHQLGHVDTVDTQTETEVGAEDNREEGVPSHLQDHLDAVDAQSEAEVSTDNREEGEPSHAQSEAEVTVEDNSEESGEQADTINTQVEAELAVEDNREEEASNYVSQAEIEDFSLLTVVKLRDRLRALNLPATGRKNELVSRLNDRLYPNHVQSNLAERDARNRGQKDADEPVTEAASSVSGSKKRKTTSESDNKSGPYPKPLPARASKRAKNPSAKALQSHSAESVFDEEKSESSSRRNNASSPGVIVASKRRDDSPALLAVPENGSTLSGVHAIQRMLSMEYAETEAKKKTGKTKDDTESDTNNVVSIGSTNPRGKRRGKTAVEGTDSTAPVAAAPKLGRRTTRASKQANESQNTSITDKGDDEKVTSKRTVRTGSKKSTAVEDSRAGASSVQRSTRGKKDAAQLSVGKESPQKRGPSGRSNKNVKVEEASEGTSTATKRRSARSASAKADEASSSLGPRSSKRLRSKK